MKRSWLALIIVLLVGVVITGVIVSGGDDGANIDNATELSGNTNASDRSSTSETQVDSSDQVKISNFAYSPETITVKKGTTVTWTNEDSTGHTVTSEDDGPLDSGLLSKGEEFSFKFDEAGTFSYFCEPHPQMKAKVVVTE